MTYVNKLIIYTLIVPAAVLLICTVSDISTAAEIEEEADTVMYSDYIITGEMNGYTKNSIKVDDVTYSFCDKIIIFTPKNQRIPLRDIDAAEEVKLFENRKCVRKIKVLRFGE